MIINEKTFNDFNLYVTSMLKWNLEFDQLTRGKFNGAIKQIFLQNLIIQKYDLSKSLRIRCTAPKGFYNFSVGVKTYNKAIWRGKQLTENAIGVFPKDSELEAITPDDFSTFEIAISEYFLRKVSNSLGIKNLDNFLKGNEIYNIDPSINTRFKKSLTFVINNTSASQPTLTNLDYSKQIEFEIAESLLMAIISSSTKSKAFQTTNRNFAISLIEDLIDEDEFGNLTILDLCEKVNVSQRTLEYAFSKKYNMTIKQYLRTVKLNRVKKTLSSTDNLKRKISHIANNHGFWHMGQFAKDYKNLFGELPSETILKK